MMSARPMRAVDTSLGKGTFSERFVELWLL
jgi:hypothetical protein